MKPTPPSLLAPAPQLSRRQVLAGVLAPGAAGVVAVCVGSPTAWAAEADVHIYHSPTTVKYFADQRKSYTHVVRRWTAVLQPYGPQAAELSRERLLAGRFSGVLVLPTAVALDEGERAAILRFARSGGSVLGTGPTGTRDASGADVGTGFLQQLFHVQAHGHFPPRDDSYFMPHGDGPLTWPIPAARRVPLAVARDQVLRVTGRHEAAVVMDWSRSASDKPIGAMCYDEVERGRVVYLAPPDDAWPRSVESGLVLDAALAWLRRQPQAFKAAWPNGLSAAHLLEMDTEDQFHSAPNFAKQLEAEGFRGTFYCLTSEAIRWPDIVRDLKKRGHEIAYHADVHFGFKGDPADEQELRIRFMKQQMETILGADTREATGFRAPTESYDATTERLLRKHGLLHHAADESAHEDRLPFFSLSEPGVPPDQALVVLPRTQMDDVTFTRLKLTPDQVKPILFHDIDLAVRSGSFSLLSVHSQYYLDGGLMNRSMPEYLRRVAGHRDRLWVARGDQITQWWRQREAVSVQQEWRGDELTVSLKNGGALPVQGLSVWITLPARNARIRVSHAGQPMGLGVKRVDDFRTAVVIERLVPGQTQLRVRFG